MRDLECAGPYFSKLLLNAIMFAAAKHSSRIDIRSDPTEASTSGLNFFRRYEELLELLPENQCEIATIQARLIASASLYELGHESRAKCRSNANAAFAMLQRSINSTALERWSEEDNEVYLRVVWAAFLYDKIHSLYQGLAPELPGWQILKPLELLDDFEESDLRIFPKRLGNVECELSPQPVLPSSPALPLYKITSFTSSCKLATIVEGILRLYTAEKPQHVDTSGTVTTYGFAILREAELELRQWQAQLQPWLRYEPWLPPWQQTTIPSPNIMILK